MSWNAKYVILIFFSTIITYLCGIILGKIKRDWKINKRKAFYMNAVIFAGVSLNLMVLFYFKYINMFLQTISDIGNVVGIALDVPSFDIVLPVGISFYTFQAVGYMIDIYRGEIPAEKNFINYALFISFFPQLVAGPIERSKNLLKQLDLEKKISFDNFREGIYLMIWGFFLKIVLADRIAIYVDGAYGNIYEYGGWFLIVATVLFAIQIYCDFYGYSVIAVGAAKILGISLMGNFNAPYLATSVADFWRRWHISLTSWFKDYLYIPLGGSREGKVKKYFNKMMVFLISGLWHGADLSYVVWGA